MNLNPKRFVSSAREVFVYRLPPDGRSRKLIDNITPASNFAVALRAHGVGRYRLEWRDSKRWIVQVRVMDVAPDGSVGRARPKVRRRRVPPPVVVR